MLATEAIEAGYRLERYESLESTNEEAFRRAAGGDSGRLWIVAGYQTQGRGRAGRAWHSPPGNLYASLLLVDPAEPRHAPELGFVAGLALARAVGAFAGRAARVAIKWPNDLVRDGAKLAGILVEGRQLTTGSRAVAIGFGVNCASCPSDLPYPTTCLTQFAASNGMPGTLLSMLSTTMVEGLGCWNRGLNFSGIREAWLALALPKGTPLEVRTGQVQASGVFETIDGLGRLVLKAPKGEMTVQAGDVFLAGSGVPSVSGVQGDGNE